MLRGDSEFNKLRAMYQSEVERKVNDEFASITDWMSKHVGAMCRIAALYTLLGAPRGRPLKSRFRARRSRLRWEMLTST